MSVAGQDQDQKPCGVWERCKGPKSGALQRLGPLQERCRGRIRSVAASGSHAGVVAEGRVGGRSCEALKAGP